jgi:putative nucleotidyltransferase with HDIG domain
MLDNPRLKELLGRVQKIPSLPQLYVETMEALDSPDAAIDTLAGLIGQDPGMTAKILQIVNSAFFGAGRRICAVKEAIQCLGLSLIRVLALGHHVFSSFEPGRLGEFSLEQVWTHSLVTSLVAGQIARIETRDQAMVDAATTAGILHDLGKLLLADGSPDAFREFMARVRETDCEPLEAEKQIFGASHAEVGAYLLGLWGLPSPVVEAVAHHHEPGRAGNNAFTPLTAVHVASALDDERRNVKGTALDTAWLAAAGLEPQLPRWRQAADKIVNGSSD